MIRKWTMVLLSLLVALVLPLNALAGAQHTLTIIPGDELKAEPAIADLLDVLSITVTPGEKSGALTLSLDDMDVGTIAVGADSTALYVYSQLIADEVLYVTWDDAFALIKNAIEVSMAAESADQAQITAALEQIDLAREKLVAALGGGLVVNSSAITQEDAIAQAEAMFKDDPQMLAYIRGIFEKQVIEDGVFADEARDTADQKYTLALTAQDIAPIFDTVYMQQMIREVLAQENPYLSAAELDAKVKEQLEELRQAFENSDMEMSTVAYTLDGGNTLVGMEMAMSMTDAEGEWTETVVMNINYDRLTDEEGVNHNADLRMMIDDEEALQMLFDFHRGVDEVSEGMLAFLVEGEELLVKYHAENPETDVREREAALYLRSDAAAIIEPAASARPLIAFRVVSRPAPASVLETIEQADTSNSVNVMKLSEEEMQTLISSCTSRLMQTGFSAMGKLPTSTLNMVLSMMGMGE